MRGDPGGALWKSAVVFGLCVLALIGAGTVVQWGISVALGWVVE